MAANLKLKLKPKSKLKTSRKAKLAAQQYYQNNKSRIEEERKNITKKIKINSLNIIGAIVYDI